MEERFCQSCGMPMGRTDELYGAEKDGGRSADYCKYCYENGAFTSQCTVDEMVEICVPPMVEHNPGMTADTARAMMRQFLPTLKRWKTQ
ncbi:MAG TPA: zinc ribbon domain-containing protein [Candidatus Acidoferrum sp.]|nr:zinc ribbon domain-containing protein [Candidatus Acidoferrum sp.]